MNFVINCLGMPFNGETLNKSSLGGSETAAIQLAEQIALNGHSVKVFTTSKDEGRFSGVDYFHCGEITEENPLGQRFHFYAENTPHDVCIIQRHPRAFDFQYASRINLWWVHDLALYRNKPTVESQMWNVDGVLCVSEFHKKQICKVYDIKDENVFVLNNGVNPDLFNVEKCSVPKDKKNIVYISRPERGLSNLVQRNGIMDKLGDEYHLHICAYDNVTPQMSSYYNALWQKVESMPNATNHGALNVSQLYSLMKSCDLMVYPTPSADSPEFEEVSCIAMMEAMHCGLPVITSAAGALPETCGHSKGVILVDLNGHGIADINAIVSAVSSLTEDDLLEMSKEQLKASSKFNWGNSYSQLTDIYAELADRGISKTSILCEMIRKGDICRINRSALSDVPNSIINFKQKELEDCYNFFGDMQAHYEKFYTKMDAQDHGPREENLSDSNRFNVVCSAIDGLSINSGSILDYGCGHGHYTINLALRFPKIRFVGVDISRKNIEFARDWAKRIHVDNVEFIEGETDSIPREGYDAIICAEVLEHVEQPVQLAETLAGFMATNGTMIITTPYGSWEAESYAKRYPFREHIWHFSSEDIKAMFGGQNGYTLLNAPCGLNKFGDNIGSYITTYRVSSKKLNEPLSKPTYKIKQTLSLMMIIKDSEDCLPRLLSSVIDVVDEIVVGVDPSSENLSGICSIFETFCGKNFLPLNIFTLSAPAVEIGFGPARTEVLNKCCGDWVITLDSDEVLVNGLGLLKYLRNNQYSGYALKQHHFSNDPAGILKTDFPCKMFRRKGIMFTGMVHEHPETDINEGVGKVDLIQDVSISHYGYDTEEIRRNRFARNFSLMKLDRETNPERKLAKMLWIRDLFQLCRYEMEKGSGITQEMIGRVHEARAIWQELVDDGDTRLAIDSLEYLSELNRIKGDGFTYSFSVDAGLYGQELEPKQVSCYLHTPKAATDLFNLAFKPKIELFKNKYL